jgi:hypothetical protein
MTGTPPTIKKGLVATSPMTNLVVVLVKSYFLRLVLVLVL